jgi:putative ABC transport system substrate-binding protein
MDRRRFVLTSLAGSLAKPLAIEAQQPGKSHRIGWLAPAPNPRNFESFRSALRALGYTEGATVAIEQRYSDGSLEELSRVAAALVRSDPNVIVADGSAAASALKRIQTAIPVVFVSGDPIGMGLVPSLSRPGGNMTGLAIISTELNSKRLELLRDAFPQALRVAVLYESRQHRTVFTAMERAALSLGLAVTRLEVHGTGDLDSAFSAAAKSRVDLLMVVASALFHAENRRLVALAAQHRLPTMYETRAFPEAGGLMSYGPDVGAVFRRAAIYVAKILTGSRPADLPVEQPTTFELVINVKAAKALGFTIPQSLLLRADHVID